MNANTSTTDPLPLPPENPGEQLANTLGLIVALAGFVATIAVTFYLFNYARAAQQRSQQLWRCAENLIVSTADKLVSQQGKPVDAKFAEDISEAVNTYYERSLQQGTDALNSITQARFLGQVALFCKSQGLLAKAFANYNRSFRIYSALSSHAARTSEPWIGAYNSLSGEADVEVLQGNFREAQQKYSDSLKRRSDVLDNRTPNSMTDYAQGLVNMGDISREMGLWSTALSDVDAGIQIQADALKVTDESGQAPDEREHNLDAAAHRLAIFQRTRAWILTELGKFTEAKAQIEEVIATLRKVSSRSVRTADPDLAIANMIYGDIQLEAGDPTGALISYETAHHDWEGVVQSDHHNVLTQFYLIDAILKEGDVNLLQAAPPNDTEKQLSIAKDRYEKAQDGLSSLYEDAHSFFFETEQVKTQMKLCELHLARFQVNKVNKHTDLSRNDLEMALMRLIRSEGLYQSWLHDPDYSYRAKLNLSDALCGEGDACMELLRWGEAIKAYENSLSLRKALLQLTPENLDRRLSLAACETDLAQALLCQDHDSSDELALRQAGSLSKDSNQTYLSAESRLNENPSFVQELAKSFYCLGLVKMRSNSREEAMQHFQTASEKLNSLSKIKHLDCVGWILLERLNEQLHKKDSPY